MGCVHNELNKLLLEMFLCGFSGDFCSHRDPLPKIMHNSYSSLCGTVETFIALKLINWLVDSIHRNAC